MDDNSVKIEDSPLLPSLLRKAWYGMNQAFRRRIQDFGVTPDQFSVLRCLHEATSEMRQKDLVELMSSDANTVAALVKRMQDSGLIERHVDPGDRRAHQLALTPSGEEVYLKIEPIATALKAEILESLNRDEREQFLDLLGRVAEACRKSS